MPETVLLVEPYIRRYLPPSEWERARCITRRECNPGREGYPESCVAEEGMIDCGNGVVRARSWGPFQILDACWNPAMNPRSPFTREHWAKVLDPNVNTWMASVIWSSSGWRAWTTCAGCEVCGVTGGPIPYPRGPVEDAEIPPTPPQPHDGEPSMIVPLIFGAALVAGAVVLVKEATKKE